MFDEDKFDAEFDDMFRKGKTFMIVVWTLVILFFTMLLAAGATGLWYLWTEVL